MTTTLLSAEQLLERERRGTWPVVLDCGFDLADPAAGARAWAQAHLPGAWHADLERDLSGPKTGRNGRHPLPQPAAFAAALGRWGITPQTEVVAYDAQGGIFAARAWWLLRWMGHERVWVLDGGLPAWRAAGGRLTAQPPVAEPAAPYPLPAGRMPLIDADTLSRELGRLRLIDARAGERFRGEVEPLDARAGHVPGAVNRCYRDNLEPDGRFKPASRLRAEFEPLVAGLSTVVQQCGSGVTACHNLLAMAHAGLGDSVLYPGSWSEWSTDPSRPVAIGA